MVGTEPSMVCTGNARAQTQTVDKVEGRGAGLKQEVQGIVPHVSTRARTLLPTACDPLSPPEVSHCRNRFPRCHRSNSHSLSPHVP